MHRIISFINYVINLKWWIFYWWFKNDGVKYQYISSIKSYPDLNDGVVVSPQNKVALWETLLYIFGSIAGLVFGLFVMYIGAHSNRAIFFFSYIIVGLFLMLFTIAGTWLPPIHQYWTKKYPTEMFTLLNSKGLFFASFGKMVFIPLSLVADIKFAWPLFLQTGDLPILTKSSSPIIFKVKLNKRFLIWKSVRIWYGLGAPFFSVKIDSYESGEANKINVFYKTLNSI